MPDSDWLRSLPSYSVASRECGGAVLIFPACRSIGSLDEFDSQPHVPQQTRYEIFLDDLFTQNYAQDRLLSKVSSHDHTHLIDFFV